jgi:histone H3/H4
MNQSPISDLITAAEKELQSFGSAPFSEPAFATLKERVSQYIVELINEALKVAKRHQADTVSAAHVNRASDYLVSSSSRKIFRHLGTVGGILLGAAIGNVLAMTTSNQFTATSVLVTSGLGIIGAFLIALHIAKD